MVGVKQDSQADDTARGRRGGGVYKDVESQGGKSDSNIASGTIIGAHGSAARLVTVEHNGKPPPCSLTPLIPLYIVEGRRWGRESLAPQESVPADLAFSAGVIFVAYSYGRTCLVIGLGIP